MSLERPFQSLVPLEKGLFSYFIPTFDSVLKTNLLAVLVWHYVLYVHVLNVYTSIVIIAFLTFVKGQ